MQMIEKLLLFANRRLIPLFPDSFVSSQDWTLSRGVPEIRLGIVGSLTSRKSAMVHRYLTGTSLQSESSGRAFLSWQFYLDALSRFFSPEEGGRFKKDIIVDGQSYQLLIRDEGGPPDHQVSQISLQKTSFILRL